MVYLLFLAYFLISLCLIQDIVIKYIYFVNSFIYLVYFLIFDFSNLLWGIFIYLKNI